MVVQINQRFQLPYRLLSPPTPLIGREREMQVISDMLQRPDVRLLTLTGTAGVGKTRLALDVAEASVTDFADGVHFIPLAPLTDHTRVLVTIAEALSLQETSNQTPLLMLTTALAVWQSLLVLDNFEQVIKAGPDLTDLLAACPMLKILVTSREVLRVRAEQQFVVPPLDVPLRGDQGTFTETSLAQNPAMQLFLQRTRAAQPDFQVTTANMTTIAEICERLEGIPLALELAAPRLKLLSPQALLSLLAGRLQILVGGARDLPARQRTMRATIKWSYDLLSASERAFFRRLVVFANGWTLDAVAWLGQAMKSSAPKPLEGLTSLLDKSFISQETTEGGEKRFRMLAVLREFGLERLQHTKESNAICEAHALYYLALAEQAEPLLQGAEQRIWRERLEQEQENLRTALSWWLNAAQLTKRPDAADFALRMCNALVPFWRSRNHLRTAHDFLDRALLVREGVADALRAKTLALAVQSFYQLTYDMERMEVLAQESVIFARQSGESECLAFALEQAALVTFLKGEYALSCAAKEEAATLYQQVGNRWQRAICLSNLAIDTAIQGNYQRALALQEESLTIFQELGDKRRYGLTLTLLAGLILGSRMNLERAASLAEQGLSCLQETGEMLYSASACCILADIRLTQGRLAEAKSLLTEASAIFGEQGNTDALYGVQPSLARLFIKQGNLSDAQEIYRKHREHWLISGFNPVATADYLEEWGAVEARLGMPEFAAHVLGAAEVLRETIGAPIRPLYQDSLAQAIATTRAQLGESIFNTVWSKGRQMSPEQMTSTIDELLLASTVPVSPVHALTARMNPSELLTKQELNILRLVADGATNKQIAQELIISYETVKSHMSTILRKLNVPNRNMAAKYYRKHYEAD